MADNGNIGADCHERSSEGESASRCSLGERLKRERESRNITLQEMSESTRIALPNFKAIEDDDFAKLPGGLYNTGCIRAYAQFIGLDPDPLLEAYLLAQQRQKSEEENSKLSNVLLSPFRPHLRTWLLVPFAVIIVGV